MKDEIKEILFLLHNDRLTDSGKRKLEDYITNLQEEKENQAHTIKTLLEENERLKEIAHKMHLYIFLHTSDEQKAYDEIGLTDEENKKLGYSGQYKFKIDGEDK